MVGNGFTLTYSNSETTGGWTPIVEQYDYGGTTSATATWTSLGNTVWPIWNEMRGSNTNTITIEPTYRDSVWRTWIDDGTATASQSITLGDVVWTQWIDENGRRIRPPLVVQQPPPIQYNSPAPPNPFQVLKKKIKKQRRVRTAKKKGRALLRSICSDEQWKDYLRYGAIREVCERAIYEVGAEWSGHIYKIGFDGEPQLKLCVHMGVGQAGKRWVAEDRIAAVLLALRYDETVTIAKAGVHHFSDEDKRRVKARRGHKRVSAMEAAVRVASAS